MESEQHRYVSIEMSHPKGQHEDGEDSCRSGSGGCTFGPARREARGDGDARLKDVFSLEHVGQVVVVLSDSRFVWSSVEDRDWELDGSALLCCGATLKDTEGHIPVAEIFAVKALGVGPVNGAKSAICGGSVAPKQLHRVEVHTFQRFDGKWAPKVYLFGHSSEAVAQEWAQRIQVLLLEDPHRPKALLVFVNPYGGKGSGVPIWKQVAPLFELARIKVKVITTERAGHARDVMHRATEDELNALDGVIVVGGDGFFNEVVNGLVMHRHKAPAAIMPKRLDSFYKRRTLLQQRTSKVAAISNEQGGLKQLLVDDAYTSLETSSDHHPLLQNRHLPSLSEAAIRQEEKGYTTGRTASASGMGSEGLFAAGSGAKAQVRGSESRGQSDADSSCYSSVPLTVSVQDDEGNFLQPSTSTAEPVVSTKLKGDASGPAGTCLSDIELKNPNTFLENSNLNLRIGLIPAGSTDTVVVSTTGSRDPLTSALHIILGDRMPLDIVRITGWRNLHEDSASEMPEVRYAASFAGYGFYGDVMRESEDLRWMGPARYDMAGFKVFMQHKSYEADISFLDIPQKQSEPQTVIPQGPWSRNAPLKSSHDDRKKVVCVANCAICASGFDFSHVLNSDSDTERGQHGEEMQTPTWRTCHTKFHSIGAAVMSCRNDKAPEGVAAHAHLADGLLHLILIRECSRPDYLRQLLRLARRGADPFNFSFVDHYKTPLFTFTSHGDKESVWSVDGELLPARQLTGQVFRGLVNLFARGPET